MHAFACSMLLVPFLFSLVFSAPPAIRDQVLLNGTWPAGGTVPTYIGSSITTKSYERSVDVPSTWTGKTIKLDFYAVNFYAKIFVNNVQVGEHTGPWNFFSVDITSHVQPGSSFTLRIDLTGAGTAPLVNAQGQPLWPTGILGNGPGGNSGICDDVYLRAYGKVAVDDSYVKTSFRNKTITVDYTVSNYDNAAHTVTVTGDAVLAGGTAVEKNVTTQSISLAAGETKTVSASTSWSNPQLWWPHDPKLYHLVSKVMEGTTLLDQETKRFGFREFYISGNRFMLNGTRANLRGDNIPWPESPQARTCNLNGWTALVDTFMNRMNFNVFRIHRASIPKFCLEVCDEKGLMVISESALYGNGIYNYSPRTTLLNNYRNSYVAGWIKIHRNYPSIIMWSASNEDWISNFSDAEKVGNWTAIRAVDATRPIEFDGDAGYGASWDDNAACESPNHHYPEGYGALVPTAVNAIYNWPCGNACYRNRTKPEGIGEFLACCWISGLIPNVYWWQGTWVRGLRYTDWADLRPYKIQWAWNNVTSIPARVNVVNSMAAVALFDKDYDGLGIAPRQNSQYPSLTAGANVARTLVLYNDEFVDTIVTIKAEVTSGGTSRAIGTKTVALTLGNHVDIPCTLQVPYVGGSQMQMVLSTTKGGVQRFNETNTFNVTGGQSGASSNAIKFAGPAPVGVHSGSGWMRQASGIAICRRGTGLEIGFSAIDAKAAVLCNVKGTAVARYQKAGLGVWKLQRLKSGLYVVKAMDSRGEIQTETVLVY